LNDKIIDSFKLFVQLLTAVTAGYVWWKTQPNALALPWPQIVFPTLTVFIGVATALLIIINSIGWWGYRKAESSLLRGKVPLPTFPRSAMQEIIMIGVVFLTTVAAVWYFAR